MIWNDDRIRNWAEQGGITPYNPERINPASIDLCLGEWARFPEEKGWSQEYKIHPKYGITLQPNDFYLLHSLEITNIPSEAVAFLFLKSSTGRKGIEHLHAGYGDPGFCGQWTFEVINHWPYPQTLYVGQPLFQIVICSTNICLRDYSVTGHYQNQTGATMPWEWGK